MASLILQVVLCLSANRRLGRSPLVRSALGNPRALAILAGCIAPAGAPRPLRVLERVLLRVSGEEVSGALPSNPP